jgi:acetyl esterase/lipase
MFKLLPLLFIGVVGWSQEVVHIWPEGAPGSEARKGEAEKPAGAGDFQRVTNVHNPSMKVFLPEKGNGTGIVVLPGGGHRHLAVEHEGENVAKYFNKLGVAVFVLKYRLARAEGSTYTVEEHALADAKRALRIVRHHGMQWGVAEGKLGVMGFSAGGELAALAASRFDVAQGVSSRPDFQVLMYPGGKLDAITYGKDAPPAFLLMADDDATPTVSVVTLYQSLKKAGVPSEVHIFEKGGHGFGIKPGSMSLVSKTWLDRLSEWMRERKLLN